MQNILKISSVTPEFFPRYAKIRFYNHPCRHYNNYPKLLPMVKEKRKDKYLTQHIWEDYFKLSYLIFPDK